MKPANIVISPAGAKLVDFGVSARIGERQYDANGTLWGTAAYFAPEQLRGAPAGPEADVYALGLVLHTCLTGQPAWTGDSAPEVLAARKLSPNPRLPDSCEVPTAMLSIYRRCLAPRPRKRPSARRVAHLLQDVSDGYGRSRH